MKRVDINGTKDGVNTSFTLAEPSVNDTLVFVIHNGVILEIVGSSPTGYQCTVAADALEVGLAPFAGDLFFAYVQVNANHRMLPLTVDSTVGSAMFTIDMAPPTNSHIVLVRNGLTLEPVTAGPNNLQFTLAGTTGTLGLAMAANESLFGWVQSNVSIGDFAATTFNESPDGARKTFTLNTTLVAGFNRVILVVMNGLVLQQADAGPNNLQYQYKPNTLTITTGLAPATGQPFFAWRTGIVQAADFNLIQWLNDPKQERILLADINWTDGAGTVSTFYAATKDVTYDIDGMGTLREYKGIIDEVPSIRSSTQETFTGESADEYGDLVLFNRERSLEAIWGVGLGYTEGQDIALYLAGDPDTGTLPYADRAPVLVGKAEMQRGKDDRFTIPIQNAQAKLKKIIPTAVCTTGEFPNLPAGSEGREKPIIYGVVTNMRPIPVDPSTDKYLVAGHAIEDITDVRDDMVSVAYTKNLANGTFTLDAAPTGQITCDVKGKKMAATLFYSDQLADILRDIFTEQAGLTTSEYNDEALIIYGGEYPYAVGILIDRPTEITRVLDTLIKGIPTIITANQDQSGQIVVEAFKAPTGLAQLTFEKDIQGRGEFEHTATQPVKSVTLGYANIEAIQSEDLTTLVSVATKALYSNRRGYQQVKKDNTLSGLSVDFPLAQDEPAIQTRLISKADAEAVANLRLSLFGVARNTVTWGFGVTPLATRLNAVIQLKRDVEIDGSVNRHNLAGNKFLIIGQEKTFGVGRSETNVELVLWA